MPVREAASISITSTWRSSVIALQLSQTPQGSTVGAALAVLADAVQRPGDDAGGRGLADAAHAREHEGMRDAARGDGVAQGAHHRLLADQGGEIDRTVFAGEDPIGKRILGFRHGERPTRKAPWPHEARRSSRPAACAGAARARRQVRDRHDPKRIRYGCFLPDLTGLATAPPTPAPRGGYIRSRATVSKSRTWPFVDVCARPPTP